MKMFESRANEIVAAMTLDEKLHMCTGASYWTTFPLERFGIKECVMSDGPHGIRKVKERDHLGQAVNEKATGFPTSVSMGATWNKELLYKVGEALGSECQKLGVHILLGPAVNMKRSVLGGRNFEYLSEDPVLAGKLAAQMVNGIQSKGVAACMKHFACNNSETRRMTVDAQMDERTLRELYLKVFEIIVKESSPLSVMGAYNKVNGAYACENRQLLIDILRKEWGFQGIVISDWLAVEDSANAVNNGLNVEMPQNKLSFEKLKSAYEKGTLIEEELNDRVRELLQVVLYLQEQECPKEIDWEDHKKVAQKVAEESIVLLKNENSLLPFDLNKTNSIAVVGDFAVRPRTQGGGSSKVSVEQEENTLEAMIRLADGQVEIQYARGYDSEGNTTDELISEAVEQIQKVDKVVVFAGLPESYESEGYDRLHMKMPEGQLKLIHTLSGIRRDIVVVLSNGAAIEMPFKDCVDTILEAWLLGQETAVSLANVIMNRTQPSGRMPETFPHCIEDDVPGYQLLDDEGVQYYSERMMIGYRHFEKNKKHVAFPFGHGLSYTEFSYSEAEVSNTDITDQDEVTVKIKVTNVGARAGNEVVQLYVSNKQTGMLHPEKELKDFCKIYLEPGEMKEVSFTLNREVFQSYSLYHKDWIVEEGNYELLIGASSVDIREVLLIHISNCTKLEKYLVTTSTLEEWLEHSKGRALALEMLDMYRGFGMIPGERTFGDLPEFVQQIMLEMPMPRLIISSNESFTEKRLEEMLSIARGGN